jgi:16S rRNA (uracil1498-N3)-methyltransferase
VEPAAGGVAPPTDVPLAFVADLERPALDDGDRHHLERALRVAPGALISVSDGAGRWRSCRLGPELEVAGDVEVAPRWEPPLAVGFALVKGGRPELVVQKLTELGIDRVLPFVAERSVVRWDGDKAAKHEERLRRVAREACMQARRCHLPEVAPVAGFAEVATLPGATGADRSGPPPSLDRPVVLVGPEGGWSPAERAALPGVVGLGPHVLRAETAAIAAGTLLAALRAGLVAPS